MTTPVCSVNSSTSMYVILNGVQYQGYFGQLPYGAVNTGGKYILTGLVEQSAITVHYSAGNTEAPEQCISSNYFTDALNPGDSNFWFLATCTNGYTFSGYFSVQPGSGSGSETNPVIVFSESTYTVTFTETGLDASGLASGWGIALDGGSINMSSTTTNVFTGVVSGTHSFTVSVPTGWSANPSSGTFEVS